MKRFSTRTLAIATAMLGCATIGLSGAFAARRIERTAGRRTPSTAGAIVHLYHSETSGMSSSIRAVVKDSTRFAEVWSEVVRNPTAPRPAVDFTRYMVIVAAMGTRNSTGNTIELVSVDTIGGALNLHVALRVPGPNCIAGGVMTAPVDVARIPKSNRPVVFVDSYKPTDCSQ